MGRSRKNQNAFVRYFTPFGLRQVGDILMLAGFIVLIVGLCTVEGVLLAGFICYGLGAACAIARSCMTMITVKNRRAPEYKSAMINLIIMSVLFALALFGIIWTAVV